MNLEDIRTFCNSLSGVTEDIKWGNDLCFLIHHKMFCVAGLEPPFKVSFKALPDEAEELCERNHIIPAPYLARYHWVQVQDENALSEKEWRHFLAQSYELICSPPKKKLSVKKKK